MSDVGFEALLGSLELSQADRCAFVAGSGAEPAKGRGRLFGGLVAAQSALGARRTVAASRRLHSLHAYFLRSGRPGPSIRIEVEELRDGGSFSVRQVRALQESKTIFIATASFCEPEEGISHQGTMPTVPPPDGLLDRDEERARIVGHRSANRGVEVRMCDGSPFDTEEPATTSQHNWIRARGTLPDDPAIHEAILVYMSDTGFMSTVNRIHRIPWPERVAASLDHAIWLHRPPRIDDWHLFASTSPAAHDARGLVAGSIYDAAGTLVATVSQEAMIRRRRS